MAPGTARSRARGGRTPSNQGRGRGRARGTAATRGRGRGGGRGGRGGSRGRVRQGQRRKASRGPRTTQDGGEPHGFLSLFCYVTIVTKILQEKAGRSVLHKAPPEVV